MSDTETIEAQRVEIARLKELLSRAVDEIEASIRYIRRTSPCDVECEECNEALKLAAECRAADAQGGQR